MKVSVIIPTYNRSKLLLEAVDSVLNQTYRDFEIIIVDDGSTDDTEQKISRYAGKVTYIKQQNAGVNAARNHGISLAKGGYIALLDNDDLWLNFKLASQVTLLNQYPEVGFVFSDFTIRKETGQEIGSGLQTWHTPKQYCSAVLTARKGHHIHTNSDFNVYCGDIYHPSLFVPYVLPSTALVRGRCLDPDIRLVDHDPTCGDWDFFARLSHRYSALFMELDTTINRSHEDAVRLTRLPQQLQLARRLEMIERIWKSDREFYAKHQKEVDLLEHSLLLQLATHQAMNADIHAARDSLHRRHRLVFKQHSVRGALLATIIHLPGGAWLLNSAKSLKRACAILLRRHR